MRSGDEAKETREGRERRVGRLSVMAKCRSPLTGPAGGQRMDEWMNEMYGWMDDNILASGTPLPVHARR